MRGVVYFFVEEGVGYEVRESGGEVDILFFFWMFVYVVDLLFCF